MNRIKKIALFGFGVWIGYNLPLATKIAKAGYRAGYEKGRPLTWEEAGAVAKPFI